MYRLIAIAAAGVLFTISVTASADIYNWLSSVSGDFDDPANWTGGSGLVPGPADEAYFAAGGS